MSYQPGGQPPFSTQPILPTPPKRKLGPGRIILIALSGVIVLIIGIGVIAAAAGSGKTSGSGAGASASPVAAAQAAVGDSCAQSGLTADNGALTCSGGTWQVPQTSAPAAAPSSGLSSGDAAFVADVTAALTSGGFSNANTDAQTAAIGDDICKILSDGGSQSTLSAAFTNKKTENLFNMSSKTLVSTAHRDICPSVSVPQFTVPQQQAIDSAESYISEGDGFSKAGLYQQLHSQYGEGFSASLARFAVNHIRVNWRHQAVLSARGYMQSEPGWSYSGLVQQLDSPYGGQFTVAQAEYGAKSVGL